MYNFFGPRTTFYGQLGSSLDAESNMEVFYNKKDGLWMQHPAMI